MEKLTSAAGESPLEVCATVETGGHMSDPGHVSKAIAAFNSEAAISRPDPAVARRIIQAMTKGMQEGAEPCACKSRHTSGAITLAELQGVCMSVCIGIPSVLESCVRRVMPAYSMAS